MTTLRRRIIAFFTFIGGFYFFLEFILPKEIGGFTFGAYHEQITKGVQVVGIMAIGLGLINILKVHGGAVLYLRTRWQNSLVLLLGFFITLTFELMDFTGGLEVARSRQNFETLARFLEVRCGPAGGPAACEVARNLTGKTVREALPKYAGDQTLAPKIQELAALFSPEMAASGDLIVQMDTLRAFAPAAQEFARLKHEEDFWKRGQSLIHGGFFVPLSSAMFALLGFYIANAAYRSFRVRSLEATVLMAAALLVMLGQIPHGPLYISESLPQIRLWLLKTISTPAFRAIYFGTAIAGLAMAVRMWLSLERGPLLEDEDARK